MKRKFAFILAIMLVLAFFLAACGNGGGRDGGQDGAAGNGAGEPITLSYWVHDNPAFIDIAERFAESYSAANENITIIVESFPDFWTKVYASLATGTAGDIVEMYGSTLRFAKGGVLVPVPESVMTVAEIEATFYPGSLENRLFEGRYYGLPSEMNIESPGLLVNTALLRAQDMEIPDSWRENDGPASWAELMDFAHQLTIFNNGVMTQAGLGIVGGEEISMMLSLIWQLGGEFRDPDNMRVNFSTPEAHQAAQFVMDLITGDDAVHSALFSPRREGFMEGTVAMTIGAPWAAAVIDHDFPGFEYEYFNLPPFIPGSNPYFLAEGGWGCWVPTTTVDAEAAWAFVTYMLTEENQLEYAVAVGCLPANMALSNHEFFTTGEGRYVIGRAIKMADYGRDPGSFTIDPSTFIWSIARSNFDAIVNGVVTIDEGLALIERETNEMIARLQEGELFDD